MCGRGSGGGGVAVTEHDRDARPSISRACRRARSAPRASRPPHGAQSHRHVTRAAWGAPFSRRLPLSAPSPISTIPAGSMVALSGLRLADIWIRVPRLIPSVWPAILLICDFAVSEDRALELPWICVCHHPEDFEFVSDYRRYV